MVWSQKSQQPQSPPDGRYYPRLKRYLNCNAGVLEDVQKFYSISNAEAGLLQTSFIMSYMLLSPIFGYLGDRYNRVCIMAAGVLFWSLITLAGSFIPAEVWKKSCDVCTHLTLQCYIINMLRLLHIVLTRCNCPAV